jgi:hypothetical protein
MSSKMIKELRKFFKDTLNVEADHENPFNGSIQLWCESLAAVLRYDSPDCGEVLAEEGMAQIEKQTEASKNSLANVDWENPTIVTGTVKQFVEELVLTKQEQVLNAMQTAAITSDAAAKVLNLAAINENDSLFDSIRNNVQPGAIPMIFAVFSRKNDGYGVG